MSVTATPTLSLAGSPVATGGTDSLVGIDTLTVSWGRGDLLSQTTPATARVSLLDRSPGLLTASRTDLIGRPLGLGWATDTDAALSFQGRVTDVVVTWLPDKRAARVDLSATSKEVDAANYTAPGGTSWPAESFAARLARIVALMPAGLFTGGVHLPSKADVGIGLEWPNPALDVPGMTAAPVDVGGKDALSLLRQLWASAFPMPLVYDPTLDALGFVARRRYVSPVAGGLVHSARLLAVAEAANRYVARPVGDTTGLELDSRWLAYSGPLSQPIDARVTSVEVSFLDAGAGYGQASVAVPTPFTATEGDTGRRVLSVDTVHADAAMATWLAGEWADVASRECATPRLGTLTYSTALSPFPTAAHAAALLSCFETSRRYFLGGSWLPRLATRPMVGVVGGRLSYSAGHWSIDLTPAPVAVIGPAAALTIAGAATTTGRGVGDPLPPIALADVDPSVTFGDLGYVSVGAGYTPDNQPT